MLIIVTLLPSGRQVSPEVEGRDLVEALRQQINELATPLVGAGVAAPHLQIICFGKQELKDGHVLADYGIQKESELRCVLRKEQHPILLDVGGTCCSATLDTLQAVRGSLLDAMFEPMRQGADEPVAVRIAASVPPSEAGAFYEEAGPLARAANGSFLIDRDGPSFQYVLRYLNGLVEPAPEPAAVPEPEPAPEPDVELLDALARWMPRLGRDTSSESLEPSDVMLPESEPELLLLIAEAQYYGLPELVDQAQARVRRIKEEEEARRLAEVRAAEALRVRSEQARAEPRWVLDAETEMCLRCGVGFSSDIRYSVRRHHCRYCGWVVCGACSQHTLQLDRTVSSKPPHEVKLEQFPLRTKRVCDGCFEHAPVEIAPRAEVARAKYEAAVAAQAARDKEEKDKKAALAQRRKALGLGWFATEGDCVAKCEELGLPATATDPECAARVVARKKEEADKQAALTKRRKALGLGFFATEADCAAKCQELGLSPTAADAEVERRVAQWVTDHTKAKAGGNVVANGDFEADKISGWAYQTPQGWRGAQVAIARVGGSTGQWGGSGRGHGDYYIAVQTGGNYVEQTIELVVGQTYNLCFMAAQRVGMVQGSVLVVKINGQVIAEYGPNAKEKLPHKFKTFKLQLTATESPSVLRFENASPVPGDRSFLLDYVRLIAA
jgi:hypothetical protein